MKHNDSLTSDTTKAISDAMKNPPPMDAQAKAEFGVGLVSLAQGILKYIGMKDAVTSFSSGLSSASPMMLPKLQMGAYIVKALPTDMSTLGSTLNNAISFAKAHDIAVPADATKAMSAI